MIPIKKRKLLLVEDDENLSEMYDKKFNIAGYEVLHATDGEKALAIALKEKPEVILLDILLPKMDGLTMLRRLRQDVWGKNIPVIILTNLNTNDAIIKDILENHPAFYIMKANVTPNDILDKVEEVLQ